MFICKKFESQERTDSLFHLRSTFGNSKPEELAILVFKTSLKEEADIARVKPQLESLPGIQEWSVDNSDCDNVLRVAGSEIQTRKIIALIRAKGYDCEVLP